MSSGGSTTKLAPQIDQYHALRDGRGFVELRDWSSVTLSGADRQSFLHNFCTNDIKRLAPGQNSEAFVTNVKGKTIGYGLVTCRGAESVFITVPEQAAKLLEHLERYVIREDVQLRDTTGEIKYLLLSDKRIDDGLNGYWIAWDLIGRPGSGLVEVPAADLDRVRSGLVERGAMACDAAAFEMLRIEAGTPLFGVDFDDANLPQEIGRDKLAISFTKGCYLGQETVARIDAIGHVNQQLAGVQFVEGAVPQPSTDLKRDDHLVGQVTSATFSPRLNSPLALAMLKRDSHVGGTVLESAVGAAKVVALPVRSPSADVR
jgi:folate-binding protein YgfZ